MKKYHTHKFLMSSFAIVISTAFISKTTQASEDDMFASKNNQLTNSVQLNEKVPFNKTKSMIEDDLNRSKLSSIDFLTSTNNNTMEERPTNNTGDDGEDTGDTDKPDTGGGYENPDKPDKPDTGEGSENPDKPDKPDTGGGSENPDKPDKPDAGGGSGNPDKPDKPDKPDRPDKPDKPDTGGGSETPGSGGGSGNPGQPNKPDKPNNGGTGNSNPSGNHGGNQNGTNPAPNPSQPIQSGTNHTGQQPSNHQGNNNSDNGNSTNSQGYTQPNNGSTNHQTRPSNERQWLNRFDQMSAGSFKYNPFILNQIKQLSSNSENVSDRELSNILRKQNFSDNRFLNELQKGTNYFKFQYFNPLKNRDYYKNLDRQVLALITGDIGSMPDLKKPVSKDSSGKYEYHSSSDEEMTQTKDKSSTNAMDIKFERALFASITAMLIIFIGVVLGYIVNRKKRTTNNLES
ncbi:SdrH family protein [Staphylococcus caeli]|uniref:Membrane anchored protein n=1 Tax=Staphylococcus caeli TaxID=2201815 RepID=A0A1D4PU19_9STAP|nr:SdrH family protein [Staphylococcus caeli]SCT26295.1 membrane anchored protein [Staphylococcus caeli]SCT47738.1 membrane anchored protein [Staphylococcus caeli]